MKIKQVKTRKLQGRKLTKMKQQDEGRSKTEVQYLFSYRESTLLPRAEDLRNGPLREGYHLPPTSLLQLKGGYEKRGGGVGA